MRGVEVHNWFGSGRRRDLNIWLDKQGEEFLRKIGVREGQTVLDFGCGRGNYAIPAAIIVGEEGRVYALDKNRRALDELMQTVEGEGLRNVTRIDTAGEVEIRLEDGSADMVLLYDIFWYFPLTDEKLPKLLSEVYRVTADGGLLSVYPKHINLEQLRDKIESAGFELKGEHFGRLIHDDNIESGRVLNFRKRNENDSGI
jgi:ubiquinone/menaquinone biosynthesis C-methylase UbiE